MKVTYRIVRFISRHTWWWTFAFLIFLAISLTAARLLLPQLEHYKSDLEEQISQTIGQPVSVAKFEVGWHGYGPRLFLHDVQLLDESGAEVLFSFQQAHIDMSLPLTIYRGQIALHHLTLSGIDLTLERQTDGRITLGKIELSQGDSSEMSGDGGRAVLGWLFRQKNLAIENSILHWRDYTREDFKLTVRDVNVNLRNSDEEHFLSGQVSLPYTLGGQVKVMAKAHGPVDQFERWPIDFYTKGTGLELVQWLVDQPNLGMRVDNGTAEVELWGGWQDNHLDYLKGYLYLRDAYLSPDKEVANAKQSAQIVSSLFGEFVWQTRGDGWSLDVDRLRLVMDEVAWQPARVHVEQSRAESGNQLEVITSFARVDDITILMSLSSHLTEEQRRILLTTKPRGEIHDAYISLQLAEEKVQDYFVRADLKNFALLPWEKLPGFDGLDLSVNMSQASGVANIDTHGAYFDFRNLFRDFFVVDELQGRLAWRQDDDGVLLELRQIDLANQDAAARLDGQIFLAKDKSSPVAKLLLDIKRGNGENTSRYLPAKIMPPKSVEWLDRGIIAGDVTSGAMVFQGPLKRFPFNDGSGRFEIRFNVSNGILDYQEDWPRIEQIETEVAFIGGGMAINAVDGKVLSSDIKHVTVEIPDMRAQPAVLSLTGRAEGSTNDVVKFLNQSPLHQHFGSFTEGANASGNSRLDLSLTIPLEVNTKVETSGRVSLENSSIDFTRLGVDLTGLSGQVGFTGEGLSAEAVSAVVLGQPASLKIFSEELPQEKINLVFEASGVTHYPELHKRHDLFVFPYLEGSSEWRARLEIPRNKKGGIVQPTLKINSDLRGTEVILPPPLAKGASEPRNFELFARFDEQASHWFFDYQDETLAGAFELAAEAGLRYGELHFGAAAELPKKQGLRIVGSLDHFNYDVWRPLLEGNREEITADQKAVLNQLDLQVNTVELLGQSFHDVNVQGEYGESYWVAQVESNELSGKLWLPDNWDQVLEMDLEFLYLAMNEQDAGAAPEPFDPNDLPPLNIKSKQAQYGRVGLGQIELVTRKRANGLNVEKFTVSSDIVSGNIEGSWTKTAQHSSSVSADLRIYDLGSLLGSLGFVETVRRGEGVSQLNLSWNGPLLDYDLASLGGTVNFDFNDGSLLDVDPGAGRLFGLLSVSALPRRLSLDFSDFFGKGLGFDYLRGHFDIKDGNATTENFALDGPAAKIEIQGRVGLWQQDYDQRVKVVPHVTSGLPILAGILTGAIAPALVVALIEKLAQPGLEKASGIYYQVTGSWDEPTVEPVELVRSDEGKKAVEPGDLFDDL